MLGIDDTGVWLAYVLCLISAVLCVIYGAINWNRGDEPVEPADRQWAADEQKQEAEL